MISVVVCCFHGKAQAMEAKGKKNYSFKNVPNVTLIMREENICKDQTSTDLSDVLPVKPLAMPTPTPTKVIFMVNSLGNHLF